jgi:CRISPR-associated protein Cmr2
VTHPYWQAKIWGLLHDPILKTLRTANHLGDEGPWNELECMQGWVSPKEPKEWSGSNFSGTWLKHINLCDLISSASDRSSVARIPYEYGTVTYDDQEGLEICHLLSGKKQTLRLQNDWHTSIHEAGRNKWIADKELEYIPECVRRWEDPRKVFWWLWRCYPEYISRQSPEILLLPGDTRIPDASLWSHTSMTAALAGALAGYYPDKSDYPKKRARFKRSRPHLTTFTFTPVQEFIKASRKMRDFWAGSWLLHYLSARICWNIAWKYGPDVLVYPCLYKQSLIDHWLLEKYPDFNEWIILSQENSSGASPQNASIEHLLTAGFPNVIFAILPDNAKGNSSIQSPIYAAMQTSQQTLKEEWEKNIGQRVLKWLQQRNRHWETIYPKLWNEWTAHQWQSYWVSLPLGDRTVELHKSPRKPSVFQSWKDKQNNFLQPEPQLFDPSEDTFFKAIWGTNATQKNFRSKQPNINVGSWWASNFDQLRGCLAATKTARSWKLPTAFGPRSTISGMGSVLHPLINSDKPDWVRCTLLSRQKNTQFKIVPAQVTS